MSNFYAIKVDRNSGSEAFWAVADAMGLTFVAGGRNWTDNGLAGNTYPIKDQLKAAGFRWNNDCKAWMNNDLNAYKKLIEG